MIALVLSPEEVENPTESKAEQNDTKNNVEIDVASPSVPLPKIGF